MCGCSCCVARCRRSLVLAPCSRSSLRVSRLPCMVASSAGVSLSLFF